MVSSSSSVSWPGGIRRCPKRRNRPLLATITMAMKMMAVPWVNRMTPPLIPVSRSAPLRWSWPMASATVDAGRRSMPRELSWAWSGPMKPVHGLGEHRRCRPRCSSATRAPSWRWNQADQDASAVKPKNTRAAVSPRGRRGRRRTTRSRRGPAGMPMLQARKNMDRMKKNGWTTMASSTATPSVTAMASSPGWLPPDAPGSIA